MKPTELKKSEVKNFKGKIVEVLEVYRTGVSDNHSDYIEYLSFHKTEEEAINQATKQSLEIGYSDTVEKLTFDVENIDSDVEYDSLQEFVDENFDLIRDIEEVYRGDENKGQNIEGSIIIRWNYERYVGYARNLEDIGVAGEYPFEKFNFESDLITGNEDRTFHSNYSILLTKEQVENSSDLKSDIENALNESHWKWNYFKKNPNSEYIVSKIEDILVDL
jgi:hypothetical protein